MQRKMQDVSLQPFAAGLRERRLGRLLRMGRRLAGHREREDRPQEEENTHADTLR